MADADWTGANPRVSRDRLRLDSELGLVRVPEQLLENARSWAAPRTPLQRGEWPDAPPQEPTRVEKVLGVADSLLDRIAEEVDAGDASLLSDLSDALWNVTASARNLEELGP